MPSPRVHIVAGGFPLGAHGGHDHDYARLRILELLEQKDIKSSVSSDYNDVDRFLPISRLLITYTAGPVLNDAQAGYVDDWLKAGGRWLGLHGTSGGKAARVEGSPRRRMVRMKHHEVLGGFFINHPPVRRFNVDVDEQRTSITNDLPESFEVIDEPYMIEVKNLAESKILLTAGLGPDPTYGKFGFDYDEDTALLPDGKTRVIAYTRDVNDGAVTYIALGHCHSPSTNSQTYVDSSVAADGTTPKTLRATWEAPAFAQLLSNAIDWGMG